MSTYRSRPSSVVRASASWVGKPAAAIRANLRARRVVTIRRGPAEGMRIGLKFASNEYRDGLIEVPVQSAVASLVTQGCVFYDIGANVGFFTLVAAGAVGGEATLIAFEPRSDVASVLSANLRRNQIRAQVWAVAVGDRSGVTPLLVADHPGGATIEPAKAFDTQRIQVVALVSIDELVEQGRLPVPDVVKLDVEGAEPAVVRGMSRTLQLGRTTVVYEVDAPTSEAVEEQFAELAELFEHLGYASTRLEPSYEDAGWHVIHAIARPNGASVPDEIEASGAE